MRVSGAIPLLLSAISVYADKDTSYYNANHGNPNVKLKMYWKDADNIFDDLSQFSSLRIVYHNCVWSYVYDENDNEQAEDGSDTWYQGSVPSMGANVAFSLYGTLKGQRNKGCNEKTFINSFYTNTGFYDFIQSMEYAGITIDSSGYTAECGGAVGVGCDYDNGFALHTYSTDQCNPAYFSGVSDTLTYLNQGMKNVQCTEIYNSNSGYSDDDTYGGSSSALTLLKSSNSCNYMNYWSPDGNCPDPYGKIKKYISNYNNGIEKAYRKDPIKTYNRRMRRAKTMMLVGTLSFILAGLIIHLFAGMNDPKRRAKILAIQKKFFSRKKRSKKKSKSTQEKSERSSRSSSSFSTRPDPMSVNQSKLGTAPSPESPRAADPPAIESRGSPLGRMLLSSRSRSPSKKKSSFSKMFKRKKEGSDDLQICDTDDFEDEGADRYAVAPDGGPQDPPIVVSRTASHSSAEII
ncbi:unnamed protein product [Cylindrotheca closterium]|uniref:Uncharacterized protein n=1 Tax=Cylindrotheca closterium TaxID=2856 RepID=A0AAD2FYL7_9STRA|nr:unnamed protein product [Cylindrotheca closterium]